MFHIDSIYIPPVNIHLYTDRASEVGGLRPTAACGRRREGCRCAAVKSCSYEQYEKQLLGTANRRLIKALSNPRTNAVLSAQPNLLYAVNRRVVGLRSNGAVVNECPVDIQIRDRLFRRKASPT